MHKHVENENITKYDVSQQLYENFWRKVSQERLAEILNTLKDETPGSFLYDVDKHFGTNEWRLAADHNANKTAYDSAALLIENLIQDCISKASEDPKSEQAKLLNRVGVKGVTKCLKGLFKDHCYRIVEYYSFQNSLPTLIEEFKSEFEEILKNPSSPDFEKNLLTFFNNNLSRPVSAFNDAQMSILRTEQYKLINEILEKTSQSNASKVDLKNVVQKYLQIVKSSHPLYENMIGNPESNEQFFLNLNYAVKNSKESQKNAESIMKSYTFATPSEERNFMIKDTAKEILKAYEKLTENEKEEIQKFCNYGTMNFRNDAQNVSFIKVLFQHSNLLLSDDTLKVMENMSALELSMLLLKLRELTQEVDKELTQEYYASKINPLSMNDLEKNSQLSAHKQEAEETLPGAKDEMGQHMQNFQKYL